MNYGNVHLGCSCRRVKSRVGDACYHRTCAQPSRNHSVTMPLEQKNPQAEEGSRCVAGRFGWEVKDKLHQATRAWQVMKSSLLPRPRTLPPPESINCHSQVLTLSPVTSPVSRWGILRFVELLRGLQPYIFRLPTPVSLPPPHSCLSPPKCIPGLLLLQLSSRPWLQLHQRLRYLATLAPARSPPSAVLRQVRPSPPALGPTPRSPPLSRLQAFSPQE